MQVNAIISSVTAGGKKLSTTISHLRQSQESKAEQLGIALNALTTNTYQSTKVNEIDITDFTPGKTDPIITYATEPRKSGNFVIWDILTSDIPASEFNVYAFYDQNQSLMNQFAFAEVLTQGTQVLEGNFGIVRAQTGTLIKIEFDIAIAENESHNAYFRKLIHNFQ